MNSDAQADVLDPGPVQPVTRRRFLAGAVGIGAALAGGVLAGHWLEAGPSRAGGAPPRLAPAQDRVPLVVITMYGGNDGLNTVVPYTDPAYRTARPALGYDPSEVLPLTDGLGLNPKLSGLHSLWQSGELAIVRGVGYTEPSLSHFQSMDIWQTADPTGLQQTGWIGRWLDLGSGDPMQSVSVGTTLPILVRGAKRSATAITSTAIRLPGPPGLQASYGTMQAAGPDRSGLAAAVAASGADLLAVRTQLDRLNVNAPAGTDLASQLGIVAGLIHAGAPTRVYQVSISSFDTHAGEKADHERLLQELDQAVTAFFHAVPAKQVTVMTYSEFGRRPAENASGGTDHGTAAPLFVAGGGVKGGRLYGEEPSLTSLDANGNLVASVDFRSVYATVLDRVLGTDPADVLAGRFPLLDFI